MAKFHINREDGTVGPCNATKGKCPYGGDENHFTSMAAAADAYEKVMSGDAMRPTKRSAVIKDDVYGFKLKTGPIDYVFELDTDRDVASEINSWDVALYEKLRRSGHAVTHREAAILVHYMNKLPWEEQNAFQAYRDEHPDDDYHTAMVNFINAKGVAYTNKLLTTKELNETLVERTKKAVFMARPFGFPEDELARSNMDKNESRLLKAVSSMTGLSAREVLDTIRDKEPLDRPLESASEKDLLARKGHIGNLVRPNEKHIKELLSINRELGIREVLELRKKTSDDVTFWREAADKLSIPGMNFRIVRQLVGAPSKAVLSKLTEDERKIWSPRFGR